MMKFHKKELLDHQMHCSQCKENQMHFKRLEIFRLPPVLVIQLKRFKQAGNHWRKLTSLVDFPVRNLNMEQYLSKANPFSTD